MFVRLVVACRDEDSRCRLGVFQAAYRLRDRGLLGDAERLRCEGLLRWFDLRLPAPDRLSRSRRPHAQANAVCWFKADAREPLARVRELADLLERHGVLTEELRTQLPGYIVYEDDVQVAAVPFRGTRA
jgi:hypothetical protein